MEKASDSLQAFGWAGLRVLYYVSLIAAIFVPMYNYLPNYICYGKWTPLEPADFIPIVRRDCLPTVVAVSEFIRDRGYPQSLDELVPKYLPSVPFGQEIFGNANNGAISFQTENHQFGAYTITYDFPVPGMIDSQAGGWHVVGRYANGPIPLPPVTVEPLTARHAQAHN